MFFPPKTNRWRDPKWWGGSLEIPASSMAIFGYLYISGVYTMPIRLLPKKNTNPRNNVPRIGLTRSPENKFLGVTESKIRGYINGWKVSSQEVMNQHRSNINRWEERFRVSDCFFTKIYCKDRVAFKTLRLWLPVYFELIIESVVTRCESKVTKGRNKEVPCHGMQPLVANGRGTQTLDWYGGLLVVGCFGSLWL